MSFHQSLEQLEDPRRKSGRYTYKLSHIIFMALVATLAGENNIQDIAEWCEEEIDWLNNYLDATYKTTPSPDTFSRTLGIIKKNVFASLLQEMISDINDFAGKQIALDGKTTRGSGREGANAIHTMNAYAVENGLAIAVQDCGGRGYEIKGLKNILTLIQIKGNLISIDAIGCQTAICEQIIQEKGDYLIATKGNQGSLFEAIKDEFKMLAAEQIILGELEKRNKQVQQSQYSFLQANLPKEIAEKWFHVKTLIKEEKLIDSKVVSTRYFISSSRDIERLSQAVRRHWAIENSLHWQLDVCFGEDDNTSYKNNTAQNFGVLRKIALNTIKTIQEPKKTLKSTRRQINKNLVTREKALEILGFNPKIDALN